MGGFDFEVPKICLGIAPLASMPEAFGYSVSEADAKVAIRAILEGPLRFVDMSRNYGAGRAEKWFGDVLRDMGGKPQGLLISTKLDRESGTDRFDASQARRSLEESLKAIGVDRVDILHLHDPEYAASLSDVTKKGGAIDELMKMKAEGLARAVGLAAGRVDVMMPLLRDYPFDALITHNRYSLLNRNADEMIRFAHGKGIKVLNAAPFSSGVLAKGSASGARHAYQDLTPHMRSRVEAIEAVCAKHQVPMGAAALQFSMRDPRVTSTICGVSKPDRAQKLIAWSKADIPQACWDEIGKLPFDTSDPEATRDYQAPS
jgi:D-threo-aldose 1-dehydrogenase